MSFSCPIESAGAGSLTRARVRLELTALGAASEVRHLFRFDTGADVTTVSEDVAAALGLPAGGPPVHLSGSAGATLGRLVPVTFRFPPDALSGTPGPQVASSWAVVSGRTGLALVSLHEVHSRYTFWTDDTDMYFTDR